MPVVSVLVPTYNHEAHIGQALESVLNQETNFDYDIVVHDDASTDDTVAEIKRIMEKYPNRINAILRDENQFSQGKTTIATLLPDVDSEFVAFCEGDDYWSSSHKLQKQVDFMRANPELALTHHRVSFTVNQDQNEYRDKLQQNLESHYVPISSGSELATGNFIMTCTAMLRRSALRDEMLPIINGVRPGDWIVFSLACESGDIGFIDEAMAAYRIHEGGFWSQQEPSVRRQVTRQGHWFLAGVLQEPLRQKFQEALIASLIRDNDQDGPIRTLNNDKIALYTRARQAEEQIDVLTKKHRARVDSLTSRVATLVSQRDKLQSDVAYMQSSYSWRVTKPLRMLRKK